MRHLLWVTLLFLVPGLACGPHFSASTVDDEVIRRGSRVAVMPLENLSGRENASEKMTEYLALAMSRVQGLEMVELASTYEQMRHYRVRSSTFLTGDQIDSLARSLDVQYIVTGTVLEYSETDNTYLGTVPQVSLNLRLINCGTRKTIWAGAANARGDQSELLFGVGAVRSREELARDVIEGAVKQLADLIKG
jgi:TolB-like protein